MHIPEGLALSVRSVGIFFLYSHVMYLFLASWVFVASRVLSLVAVSRGYSSLWYKGLVVLEHVGFYRTRD